MTPNSEFDLVKSIKKTLKNVISPKGWFNSQSS